jgi:hypothetical protein
MRLKRLGANYHHADSDSYGSHSAYKGGEDDGERVYNHFRRFGGGTENFNDFNVSLQWSDVEAIVRTFSEMGHPEAVRLERARKLAAAVEEFAKDSN